MAKSEDKVDLHALIRREGVDEVAAVAGVSPGQLLHHRAGARPFNVDVMYRLMRRWPDFDVVQTVERVGATREAKQE